MADALLLEMIRTLGAYHATTVARQETIARDSAMLERLSREAGLGDDPAFREAAARVDVDGMRAALSAAATRSTPSTLATRTGVDAIELARQRHLSNIEAHREKSIADALALAASLPRH